MSTPAGWTEAQLAELHPDFRAALVPAIEDAEDVGLRPRYVSGHRPNAVQRQLRDRYERGLAVWRAWHAGGGNGPEPRRPLPAAMPGGSAHNYALCPERVAHPIRGADLCPICGAVPVPASLAVDVMLLDPVRAVPIPTGGSLPLAARPAAWQLWASVLEGHPLLRDGGIFSRPDAPHVELARWIFRERRLNT